MENSEPIAMAVEYRRLVTLEGYENVSVGITVLCQPNESATDALDGAKKWVNAEIEKETSARSRAHAAQEDMWRYQSRLSTLRRQREQLVPVLTAIYKALEANGQEIGEDQWDLLTDPDATPSEDIDASPEQDDNSGMPF